MTPDIVYQGDRVTVGPPDAPITLWIEEARP